MTDSAYKAKQWLNRTIDLHEQSKKYEREIKILESRINNPVVNYDRSGISHTDLIVRQQNREDAIIDYSDKKKQFELTQEKITKEELISMKLIDRLDNPLFSSLLLDRYINRIKWADLIRSNQYHYSKAQLHRYHEQALEQLAALIAAEEPHIISEASKEIKEQKANISESA